MSPIFVSSLIFFISRKKNYSKRNVCTIYIISGEDDDVDVPILLADPFQEIETTEEPLALYGAPPPRSGRTRSSSRPKSSGRKRSGRRGSGRRGSGRRPSRKRPSRKRSGRG